MSTLTPSSKSTTNAFKPSRATGVPSPGSASRSNRFACSGVTFGPNRTEVQLPAGCRKCRNLFPRSQAPPAPAWKCTVLEARPPLCSREDGRSPKSSALPGGAWKRGNHECSKRDDNDHHSSDTGYCWNTASALSRVAPSTHATAAMRRSNGSLCTAGS